MNLGALPLLLAATAGWQEVESTFLSGQRLDCSYSVSLNGVDGGIVRLWRNGSNSGRVQFGAGGQPAILIFNGTQVVEFDTATKHYVRGSFISGWGFVAGSEFVDEALVPPIFNPRARSILAKVKFTTNDRKTYKGTYSVSGTPMVHRFEFTLSDKPSVASIRWVRPTQNGVEDRVYRFNRIDAPGSLDPTLFAAEPPVGYRKEVASLQPMMVLPGETLGNEVCSAMGLGPKWSGAAQGRKLLIVFGQPKCELTNALMTSSLNWRAKAAEKGYALKRLDLTGKQLNTLRAQGIFVPGTPYVMAVSPKGEVLFAAFGFPLGQKGPLENLLKLIATGSPMKR